MHKRVTIIGAWFLLVMSFFALPCAAEDAKVTLVEVQGNRRIETGTVLEKIKTKEGTVFSPSVIKQDIKTLYQLGHFEDVQVKTEGFESGLKVIFAVKEKPLIREIAYEGYDGLSLETLKEGMTLLPRTAFNLQLINDNAEKLRLKYQDKGYYGATVTPVVTELKNGDRNVTFYIEEGKKVTLSEVIITGNTAISSKEIKAALKNQEWWLFSYFGQSGTLRTEELKLDVEIIRDLYFNKGYIQVQVDEPIVAPKTEQVWHFVGPKTTVVSKNELVLRFNVKEGDQFRVESMEFKGNAILSTAELQKEVKLAKGDIFSRDMLRKDVASITDRYDALARPFANVIPQFNIDSNKKTVALLMDIQEGGEVRIGRIDITGNSVTRDKVVRREMRLDEGDLYSKKLLTRSFERLSNLNYFESVDIVPERRTQDALMDLTVKVKEKSTGMVSIGGGYSSVDKIMGFLEVTQGNLFGRGQTVKLKAQMAQEGTTNSYVLSFIEPYLLDKPVSARIDLYNQITEYDKYKVKAKGLGLTFGKTFGEYTSTSLRYGFDSSKISIEDSTLAPLEIQQQVAEYGETVNTSALTWNIARDSRDYYLDPKTGSRNSLSVTYAGLGGDPNFYKAVVDSAWYYPLFWDTVFMVRGRFGYLQTLIDKPVPLADRFYVGGPGSVRGFKYGGVGPIDEKGNRVGGTKELILNFEYTFPIYPAARLKGLIFYDIGRAFRTKDDSMIRLHDLGHSAGWGIWWFSPMGPLKFEFGYALKKKTTDQLSVFDFSIGAQF